MCQSKMSTRTHTWLCPIDVSKLCKLEIKKVTSNPIEKETGGIKNIVLTESDTVQRSEVSE